MRRLWYAVVPVVVLAGVLAGCTRVPVDPVTSATPTVVVPPASPSTPGASTPTPVKPTPTWDANQQGAIDAVQEYLAVWADIGQHLPDSDVERIRPLTGDSYGDSDVQTWALWADSGWYLVGAPVFEVSAVVPSMVDSKGTRYYVHGCFIIAGSFVADAGGEAVSTASRVERGRTMYTVLHSRSGPFTVIDNIVEEGSC